MGLNTGVLSVIRLKDTTVSEAETWLTFLIVYNEVIIDMMDIKTMAEAK